MYKTYMPQKLVVFLIFHCTLVPSQINTFCIKCYFTSEHGFLCNRSQGTDKEGGTAVRAARSKKELPRYSKQCSDPTCFPVSLYPILPQNSYTPLQTIKNSNHVYILRSLEVLKSSKWIYFSKLV